MLFGHRGALTAEPQAGRGFWDLSCQSWKRRDPYQAHNGDGRARGGGERSWDQAQGNVNSPGACPLSVWASSCYATPFRGTPEVWAALFQDIPEVWATPSGAP